ncbi:MAG: glycosyl hydrolase 53 family protein [Prevotella sp.]|nr:glycosyl hydrolase 53 family protein [Prevotella sp.]
MKILMTACFAMLTLTTVSAQTPTFARGADVSWCTEMENDGKKFYNDEGTETELMALLRQTGLNAIRLRVWVNPENEYGPWCDKADVLAKAKRVKAQGMALMIDFHYSDRFTDPGQQNKPAAWKGLTMEQLKTAVANHTTDVLSALKAEGIEPQWVQVGNETRPGMIFDEGKIDWNKSGAAAWSGYIALSNAGYDAVKSILPNAKVIVHIDKGPDDNAWFFTAFKQYGGKFDIIGLSHYPDWTNWSSDNTKTANNITTLGNKFNVPVMIVETGYSAWDGARAANVMKDLFSKTQNLAACAGIFYWEPEVYGSWKPAIYNTWGWEAYSNGAFTSEGKPSAAIKAFRDETSSVPTIGHEQATAPTQWFDLQGRQLNAPTKGVVIRQQGNTTTKVALP